MPAFVYSGSMRSPGRYFLLLHTAAPPEHDVWQSYVDAVAASLPRPSGRMHAFVATDGGGPDAQQRKKLAEAFALGDAMTHVFTTDVFVRGIVTAFRWIARARAAAYAPSEFTNTCLSCGFSPHEVLEELGELQATFPPVGVLDLIRRERPARRSIAPGSQGPRV